MAEIDPRSLNTQESLDFERGKLKKEEEENRKSSEASLKAKQFQGARGATSLLEEIISALGQDDTYYAAALFKNLNQLENIGLYEMNFALALLPRVGLIRSQEANILAKRLNSKFRLAIIDKVLDGQDLEEDVHVALRAVYLEMFQNSSEKRMERIQEKMHSSVGKDIIEEIKKNFQALNARLTGLNIDFNYAAKRAIAQSGKIDIEGALATESTLTHYPQNLKTALRGITDPAQQLDKALEYFSIAYDINIDLPFEEDTDFAERPAGFRENKPATLYSKTEKDLILKRLLVVDESLARLPRNLVLNSLSLQKFLIVKEMRAYFSHSEFVENNYVALSLESPNFIQTLYHEFGHSLHGPKGDFAAYLDWQRLEEILTKHASFLKEFKLNLNDFDTNPGTFVWELFKFIYNKRLIRWKDFNKKLGIDDLSQIFKFNRTDKKIEEEYGIKVAREADAANQPVLNLEYIFEKPKEDTSDNKFERDVPVEFIAEHAQLYILHPETSRNFDEVTHDLLDAIIGQKDEAMLIEGETKTITAPLLLENKQTLEAQEAPGGIDLNPNILDLQTRGNKVDFNLPVSSQQMQNIKIKGLVPVIINITPVTNLPVLLGEVVSADRKRLTRILH